MLCNTDFHTRRRPW